MHKEGIIEKEKKLHDLYEKLVRDTSLPLYSYRAENSFLPVFGEGNIDANIVIIGEAPGKKEALTGRPFCGASGKFLDELCAHIGLQRSDVYVTNIVKDRPQDNRDPNTEEIKMYGYYLDAQLEIIQPRVIATLGRFSAEYILKKMNQENISFKISKLHGKILHGKLEYGDVVLVPLYHPAVALYNGSMRGVLKKDFEVLKVFI